MRMVREMVIKWHRGQSALFQTRCTGGKQAEKAREEIEPVHMLECDTGKAHRRVGNETSPRHTHSSKGGETVGIL